MGRYVPGRYPGRLILFEQSARRDPSVLEGWRPLAEDVESVRVEGDHHTMLREPFVGRLCRRLAAELNPTTTGP